MGRIKERVRILRRLLRLRPWPLALAMWALGMAALAGGLMSGRFRAIMSPVPATVRVEQASIRELMPQAKPAWQTSHRFGMTRLTKR